MTLDETILDLKQRIESETRNISMSVVDERQRKSISVCAEFNDGDNQDAIWLVPIDNGFNVEWEDPLYKFRRITKDKIAAGTDLPQRLAQYIIDWYNQSHDEIEDDRYGGD